MRGRIQSRNEVRQSSAYRLPVIGKVKTGEKKMGANNREYPSSLDYFRFTGKYADDVVKALGNDKPNKIGIYFADDDVKKVCDERFEARDDRGVIVLEGDGETFRAYDPATQKFIEGIDKTHPLIALHRKNIKHVLTIRFLISGFKGVLGQWELTTRGSRTSIDRIINPFDAMLELTGRVKGIPFDLTVEMVKSKGADGKTKQFPVISLIPNLSAESVEALGQNIGEIRNGLSLLTDEKISKQLGQSVKSLDAAPATAETSPSENIIPEGEHKEFNPETDLDAEDTYHEFEDEGFTESEDVTEEVQPEPEPEKQPEPEIAKAEEKPKMNPEEIVQPRQAESEVKPIFDTFDLPADIQEKSPETKPKTGMKGKSASSLFGDE
jgi:hypothetical protein